MEASAKNNEPRVGSIWNLLFRKSLPLERETSLFILVSALDVFMTYILLEHREGGPGSFYESNPIAGYFLTGWGIRGMVYYKFILVGLVSLVLQIIAREKLDVARRILRFAITLGCVVVIYSLLLYLRTGGII